MTAGGPTTARISDREIYRAEIVIRPRRTRNFFTAQQVVFDAREHAAPVTAVDGFVNHSFDFDVDAIAAEDAVVYAPQQIEQATLFARCRIGSGRIAPGFGFILRHG